MKIITLFACLILLSSVIFTVMDQEAFADTNFPVVKVTTDETTYHKGETVIISGSVTNFSENSSINIKIKYQDKTKGGMSANLDSKGEFSTTQTLHIDGSDWAKLGKYTVIATYENDFSNETTFTIESIDSTDPPLTPILKNIPPNTLSVDDETFQNFAIWKVNQVNPDEPITKHTFQYTLDGELWNDCTFKSEIVDFVTISFGADVLCGDGKYDKQYRVIVSNQYGDSEPSNVLPISLPTPTLFPSVTVTTDKSEYHKGETVIISGDVTNFSEKSSKITIKIRYNDDQDKSDKAFMTFKFESDGKFSVNQPLQGNNFKNFGDYTVIATYDTMFGDTTPFIATYDTVFRDTTTFTIKEKPIEPKSDSAQQNAYVSYNNATNQVNVSWNFDKLDENTKCLLKGDVHYNDNLNSEFSAEDNTPSFIPRFYSLITSSPVLIESVNESDLYAEEVPCTGNMRIDIDTIMNHSTNTNNYPDMQIFLTFYVPDVNGDFNVLNQYRIDEVSVLYTPNNIWNKVTQEYGCDRQIGNVLYIDQSGIHGDNGDNCGKYFQLKSNEWVNFGMNNTPDYLLESHKRVTGMHNDDQFPLLTKVVSETVDEPLLPKKGGGGCSDCTPPTLGVNKNGKRLVDDGFVYNGQTANVDYYYTEFPLITAKVGETNTVKIKIYENNGISNISRVQFGLGVPETGSPLNDAEVNILVDLTYDTNGTSVDEIIITDKQNLIENKSVNAISYPIKCQADSNSEKCLQIELQYSHREAPLYNVMLVDVMDKNRNGWIHYFNDGVQVIGESLNESPTITKFNKQANQQTENLYLTLTRTDKVNNIWTDQNDIEYLRINDYTFERITAPEPWSCTDKPLDEINVPTRNNCHFRAIMPHLWQN